MHGIREGDEINVAKSGIVHIIKKSERRSEIQPCCGWLRNSDGELLQESGLCVWQRLIERKDMVHDKLINLLSNLSDCTASRNSLYTIIF